jgi:retinol dehydrogenase-12
MAWYIYISVIAIILYLLRRKFNGPWTKHRKNMNGKVIIVTGASAGLGKESALQLAEDGADVVLATRDKSRTDKAIADYKGDKSKIHWIQLDLCSLKSVERFVEEFKKKFNKVDILMNNAGGFPDKFELSDGIDSWTLANHLCHMYLTYLLLDVFDKNEARIINLSSLGHNMADYDEEILKKLFEDPEFIKTYYTDIKRQHVHYGNLKLGNILFTQYCANVLEKTYPQIKSFAVHPGGVLSDFGRYVDGHLGLRLLKYVLYPLILLYFKTPLAGAQCQLDLCYRPINECENGGYFSDLKVINANPKAKDNKLRDAFIDYSYKLLKSTGRDISFEK